MSAILFIYYYNLHHISYVCYTAGLGGLGNLGNMFGGQQGGLGGDRMRQMQEQMMNNPQVHFNNCHLESLWVLKITLT